MSLNLVNYSDSSTDEEINVQNKVPAPVPKSKLPNPFEKSIVVTEPEENDVSKHDGRVRTFPHERGNWATYVYIHFPKTDLIIKLQDELLRLIKSSNFLDAVEFHSIDELHLSLTKTVILRHHWIDEFVRSIEHSLKYCNRFWINLNSLQIYCNDNKTRTFLSLSFAEKNSMAVQSLKSIVTKLDDCLNEFKLPAFYKEASFHVSVLWCLGDKRCELQALLPKFYSLFEHISSADNSILTHYVEQLFCKIGNKLYNFHL